MMGLLGWGVCEGGGDGVYWDMDRDRAPVCRSWMVEIWSIDGGIHAMNGYMSLQNGAKLESMHGYSNGRKVERFRHEDACRITYVSYSSFEEKPLWYR